MAMSNYAWLNPKLLPYVTENHFRLMKSKSPELCASGPTRTSKTLQCLIKDFSLHFKYYGFQSAIVRSANVDLTDSVRKDIRQNLFRYPLGHPRCPVRVIKGGEMEFTHLAVNGGEVRLGGMNRPGHVLGTDYDLVFYSQAEQSTEEEHQMLKTRCAGTAGNWIREGEAVPSFQFLMDCNPDAPDHYLKVREESELLEMIDFEFQDNPLLYPDGKTQSPTGAVVIDELDRSLVGIYHDRFFKGLWVSPRGRVFELSDCHFVSQHPDDFPDKWWHTNAMDFGMTDPNVCLWISEHYDTKDIYVWKEYRRTHTDIIEFGKAIRHFRGKDRIQATIIDNDEEKQKLLMQYCGIPTQMARKGPGSIVDGLYLIQHGLKNREEGAPGGLFFYTGLRINSDPELVRKKKPLDVIQEARLLHYPEEGRRGVRQNDLPVPGNDHGIDPLRYRLLWGAGRKRRLGFFGGGAKRQRRV